MFESHENNVNGVVRFGDMVAATRTLVIGVREYTAYVWGKRVPRTNEARARAAYNEYQDELARMGDPSPLQLYERFLTEVRIALASVASGQLGDKADAWFREEVSASLVAHDKLIHTYRPPGPEYQAFLNRLMCSLIEGFSPLQADLLSQDEVSQLLSELHYPGFWKGDPDEADQGKGRAETETTTKTESQIGST